MAIRSAIVVIVVGALFVAVPWTLGIQGPRRAVEDADVTVEGTVVGTDLGSHRGDSGRMKYDVSVTYEYTYEGRTYTDDNVYAGPGSPSDYGDRSKAEAFLDQYPVGSTVDVHLNPDDPSQSFLKADSPTPEWGFYAFMGFGVLMILGGLLGIVQGIRNLVS